MFVFLMVLLEIDFQKSTQGRDLGRGEIAAKIWRRKLRIKLECDEAIVFQWVFRAFNSTFLAIHLRVGEFFD